MCSTDHPYEAHRFVIEEVPRLDGKSLLDVGFGKGIWGYLVRSCRGGDKAYLVGLDLNKEMLDFCRKHRTYDDLILGDMAFLPFRDSAFCIVLACEVLEHLPKESGYNLLAELDRICIEKIIISTPNGFLATPSSSFYHMHKSGWKVKELEHLGYSLRGYGFLLGNVIIPYSGHVGMALHWMITPLAYLIPQISGFLVGTKTKVLQVKAT